MSSSPSNVTDKARELLRTILQHVVAEESQLAATTRRYGWRVRGSAMLSLQRLFAEQGRQIDRWMHELGAQARAVGVAFGGGLEADDAGAAMNAAAEPLRGGRLAIGELLALHENIACRLREDVDDLQARESDVTSAASVLNRLL